MVTLLILIMSLQFIQPPKNNGQAMSDMDVTHFVQVPDSVLSILKRSCYDCHSNRTNYPWYVNISPVNLLLAYHVKNGKKELNFSEFSQYNTRRMKSKLSSINEQVEKREMPLDSYLWMHKDAGLTDAEIELIKEWTARAKSALDRKR